MVEKSTAIASGEEISSCQRPVNTLTASLNLTVMPRLYLVWNCTENTSCLIFFKLFFFLFCNYPLIVIMKLEFILWMYMLRSLSITFATRNLRVPENISLKKCVKLLACSNSGTRSKFGQLAIYHIWRTMRWKF